MAEGSLYLYTFLNKIYRTSDVDKRWERSQVRKDGLVRNEVCVPLKRGVGECPKESYAEQSP